MAAHRSTLRCAAILLLGVPGCHKREPEPPRAPSAPVPASPQPEPRIDLSAAISAAEERPRDPASALQLGRAYVQQGLLADGVAYLQKASRLAPTDAAPQIELAHLYAATNYLDLEGKALDRAIQLGTNDLTAHLRLARVYLSLSWTHHAKPVVERAISLAPHDAGAQLEMARYEFRSGSTAQAIQRLRSALTEHPDATELASQLAQDLLTTGKPADAETVLKGALKQHPHERPLMLLLAYVQATRQDTDRAAEAIPLAQEAVKMRPDDPEGYCWLARSYERTGDVANAIKAYEDCQRLAPAYENVPLQLGRLYLKTGRAAEGRKLLAFYERVREDSQTYSGTLDKVALNDEQPGPHAEMGRLYFRLNALPKAIMEYRLCTEMRPADAGYRARLREALLAAGRRTEARELGAR